MTENYLFKEQKKASHGGLVMLLLFISFVWMSLYNASISLAGDLYWNYGNLLNFESGTIGNFTIILLAETLFNWFVFEIVFMLYRFVLQYKIYSFIVPVENLKVESRTFFIYRNIFYGLLLNLSFLFPYLHIFDPVFSLLTTFATLIAYSIHLNKVYAEPIIGHFVFKNFCFPVFIYQAVILLIDVIGVL